MQGKSIESTNLAWGSAWKPEEEFQKTASKGIVGIGKITKVRYHSVTSRSDVVRYIAIDIHVTHAFRRALHEKYGTELSYDYKKDTQNKIALNNLKKEFGECYPKLIKTQLSNNEFEFWIDAGAIKIQNITIGDEVEFKTKGPSIFLEKLLQTSIGNFSHMEGGEVMNQVSKVATSKQESDPLPQDQMEGAGSDEWSD